MSAPDFWDNRERAQRDVAEVSSLRGKIQPMQALESRAADLDVLRELAAEEAPENRATAEAEVLAEFEAISKDLDKFEITALLSGALSRDAAISQGQMATRRYAKRQFTWFRNQSPVAWPHHDQELDNETIEELAIKLRASALT